MKTPVSSNFSRWLALTFALHAAAIGYGAIDSPTPAPAQSAVAPAASTLATQETPVAKTADGMLSGKIEDGVMVFRGVPFAAPPVGDLRWREPLGLGASISTMDHRSREKERLWSR
jgi:Carboxylesterase family